MSITDELREWAVNHRAELDMGHLYPAMIHDIADRIDVEHERAVAAAHSNGITEYGSMVAREYVKLPVDADGEYIHVGDEMEGVDKYDSLKKVMGKVITVSFESDGTADVAIQVWSSDGKSWHRAYLDPYASVYRHHHAPTVEDVLQKLLEQAVGYSDAHTTVALNAIAEYARRLTLARGEDA